MRISIDQESDSKHQAILKQLLMNPPTAKCCKQLFSRARQLYDDPPDTLRGENAEKLLFLCYNVSFINIEY